MTLPKPVRYCPICGSEISGRKDKIFCDVDCKNAYHRDRKKQREPVTLAVDRILHRNWVLLTELYETAEARKFFVSRSILASLGFHFQYFTSSAVNKDYKRYYYLYDYAWMDFSEKEVMIIKLAGVK